MRRKTVYIAGPMRGLNDYNFDAFEAAEKKLDSKGWQVVNPFDFTAVFSLSLGLEGKLLKAAMDAELAAIPHLDAIYLLKGWERSEGAKMELRVALENNLDVMLESDPGEASI